MRAPVRLVKGGWPRWIESSAARFVWNDPRVVLDEAASPDDFRIAMSAIRVGDTYKITGADRHAVADSLVLDNVDLTGAIIVDIGASDGSTSVDLIRKLPTLKAYVIADKFLSIWAVETPHHVLFFDGDGVCILIVGRKLLAWPSMSRTVQLIYRPILARAARRGAQRREVLLLNPRTRRMMASDPRITATVHDVFERWSGPIPDVIKVANLLRRLYFSDDMIRRGLHALLQSLDEGGYLLVVDNPRTADPAPRAGIYRRQSGRFVAVSRTESRPEIDDLILGTRASGSHVA